MSALSLRLPTSLHRRARELAAREGVSINQLVATALAEKMTALMTEEFLEARARRGTRARFERALAAVPDVAPADEDLLPSGRPARVTRQPTKARQKSPRKKTLRGRVRG
jgi:hypothetical protein